MNEFWLSLEERFDEMSAREKSSDRTMWIGHCRDAAVYFGTGTKAQ